jgi:hypothetical protein
MLLAGGAAAVTWPGTLASAPSGAGRGGPSAARSAAGAAGGATENPTTAGAGVGGAAAPPGPVADVFGTAAVSSYLEAQADRSLDVTAAVYDAATGQTWLYRPTVALTAASVMKLEILQAMLWRAQQSGAPLTPGQETLASLMIEDSTDNAAQELWNTVGGATTLDEFGREVGLSDTEPNPTGYWGLSTTTALDQVRLVKELAFPSPLLSEASRSYELGLMTHVEPGEAWGVSTGVPAGTSVALKNGWDPVTGAWEVNSVGWVHGDGHDYVMAVLCWGAGTETVGVAAIDGLSQLVWRRLSPPA